MSASFDLDWYKARGQEFNAPGRCPFANVHSCPRHFQSVALLGSEGIADRLSNELDASLTNKWKKSIHWPATGEDATAIINRSSFRNFCPEVAFETFRQFGSNLTNYTDSVDRDAVYRLLEKRGDATQGDWRWEWQWVKPMHYAECPLYAQLAHARNSAIVSKEEEILTLKPSAFGFSIDLKRLLDRVARWWLTRRER